MTMLASARDAFGSQLRNLELLARTACFLSSKARVRRFGGHITQGTHTEESVPTRNQNSNCLNRIKKDRATTSQPLPDHVATANNTVQEWLQDRVEDDTLQLCVIPPNVLT